MRIGVLPSLDRNTGGIYQYSLTMLDALDAWQDAGCEDEFLVFAKPSLRAALPALKGRWSVESLDRSEPPPPRQPLLDALRRVIGEGPHREAWRQLRASKAQPPRPAAPLDVDKVVARPRLREEFRRFHLDLAVYPYAQPMAFEADIPYVMAVHDLQHRLQPEFPEVSADGEWDWREYLFRNGTRSATLILADSEVGREDILNCYGPYGVTPDRVKVLPFLPASYLSVDVSPVERQRVRTTYHLPERYLFYPAQFWPHKNHTRLVQALGLLKEAHGADIPILFCGSHAGEIRERTFGDVMTTASSLGLESQIIYGGYVPDEDMSGLYAGAVALTMPTFFGPTNIPVLEAWAYGCPVLTSDIRGIRDQVGDAGVLVDPRSIESIADGIYKLWSNDTAAATLVQRGHQRLGEYTTSDYQRRLVQILEEAKARARPRSTFK
jgi:glycosyltransferase involved in cell wall biosynthesis